MTAVELQNLGVTADNSCPQLLLDDGLNRYRSSKNQNTPPDTKKANFLPDHSSSVTLKLRLEIPASAHASATSMVRPCLLRASLAMVT